MRVSKSTLDLEARHIRNSKNEGSKGIRTLNRCGAWDRQDNERTGRLGCNDSDHYLWCALMLRGRSSWAPVSQLVAYSCDTAALAGRRRRLDRRTSLTTDAQHYFHIRLSAKR